MKTKIWVTISAVILLAVGPAGAVPDDKIFTSSGQILPGEEWGNVGIYNDDTVVDMLGGGADSVGTYDASTLNLFDGYVGTLTATQSSSTNLSGGSVYTLEVWDQASAYIYGDADVFAPRVWSSGVLTIIGGTVDHLAAIESGTINVYGGIISDYLVGLDSAVVNIYGHDLTKTLSGGAYGYGEVYGYWLDDTPFTINLNGADTYSHINLIPEPSTILLVGLGGLIAQKAFNKGSNHDNIETRHLPNAERRRS